MGIFIIICMVAALALLVELFLVVIYIFGALLNIEASYWRGRRYRELRQQIKRAKK